MTAVKQFSPYALLPLIAEYSAQFDRLNGVPADWQARAPWAYSALARESLLYGRLDSTAVPTKNTLTRLYNLFNATDNGREGASLSSVITSMFHEQFPYQESLYNEIGRTQALFGGSTPGPAFPWEEELGMSITSAVKSSLILEMWAARNGGRFKMEILDMAHFQKAFEGVAHPSVIAQFIRVATTTVEHERAVAQSTDGLSAAARRYAFNPLVKTPLVDLGQAGIWAPQPALIPLTMSVANLYHRGRERWPNYTKDLGYLVEAYIGRQLRSVKYGDVLPEIVYKKGQDRSIDWIWITPEAVILVECKSGREPLDVKSGTTSAVKNVERYLGTAREQIDKTADRIEEHHPAFTHIPTDRPIISITVTAESFYLGNSTLSEYNVPGRIPNRVLSLGELEHLCSFSPEAILDSLHRFVADDLDRPWNMGQALKPHTKLGRNRIIEEAWQVIKLPEDADLST
ncbi:hypothetical protein [Clavibacter michiganensis]|uniref:hypothetical protein n=1 Tax=Clavibacter michiganensis TaxID=28447 RepID=UPI00292DD494|nr:hypothetical protein [Clavibacter michiganensis]